MLDNLGSFLLLVIAFFAFRYYIKNILNKHNVKNDLYKSFATKHNLVVTQGKFILVPLNYLNGKIGGYEVSISEFMTGSGKNKTLNTKITFSKPSIKFRFNIIFSYYLM